MATQLISISRDLVETLLSTDIRTKWFPGTAEHTRIGFEEVTVGGAERAVAVVAVDPMLCWDHWPLHGINVFVLLLTPQFAPNRNLLPRPLPDDLLEPLIEAVIPAACGALRGHDALELASVLESARQSPNALPLPPLTRSPRSRFERRLRENALGLQRRFGPALERLRWEIDGFGDAVLRTGLGPAIGDLAMEGIVGDRVSLGPADSSGCRQLHNHDAKSIAGLLSAIQQAEDVRRAARWALEDLTPYGAQTRRSLAPQHLLMLYREGFVDVARSSHLPSWRRRDTRSQEFPLVVPAIGVEQAVSRLVRSMDTMLLADVDPLVKAVLCLRHILRVQPFGRRDRRVGELLLYLLWRQSDMPPVPLPLELHRRYWEHANLLDIAIDRDQFDPVVEAYIDAVMGAVNAGARMIERLSADWQVLVSRLAEIGTPPVTATRAASALTSHVLVPRWSSPEIAPMETECCEHEMSHLHTAGLIDLVSIGERKWWSLPAARELAEQRPDPSR
jgi:hypothetical protein